MVGEIYMEDDKLKELHQKYALTPRAFDLIYQHCQIVARIALGLLKQNPDLKVEKTLVIEGALLHDIGAYKLSDAHDHFDDANYVSHGVKGYEILKKEGFPEKLCRIASHHTGVGITKEDVEKQNLPLPKADFIAETPEEELVMYADKFHSKHPKFNSFDSYCTYVSRFGEDKVLRFKAMADKYGIPDLRGLADEYNHILK